MTRLNIADAKRQFSDLVGRVAFGGESVLITKRGRPMAQLVPVPAESGAAPHLADVRGWLESDDPFFRAIEDITTARQNHLPRLQLNPERDAE